MAVAKHVFIADAGHLGIVAEVHKKAAHEGGSGLMGEIAQGVEVGHQLIAQTKIFFEDGLGLFAIGPDFVFGTAAMAAKVRLEGAVLEPADVELRVVVVVADLGSRVGGIDEQAAAPA